jgi:molybdate transport system substrate-binding protein
VKIVVMSGAVQPRDDARAADKPTLRVFAAASLVDAFDELGRALERQRPGLTVRASYAGSQQLASQLEQGARGDVFASADTRWMADVVGHGLATGEPVLFARNRMVVIVPATNPARITRIQDLARGGVKLVLCAEAVPAGHYSRSVLGNLDADPAFGRGFARRVLGNVVSEEENVRAVVAKVQLGEADAGLAYRSDVSPRLLRYVKVLELPPAANVLAAYLIVPLKGASDPAAAKAFVDLVLSPGGQRVLGRYGFVPAGPTTP